MLLADIAERSGPAASNRVRASISAFLSWAAREGLVESNAASFTNRATEVGARTRVLSDQELACIWHASGGDQYGSLVKLLMSTGCRRAEIGALRWSEIDFEAATATLAPARTKEQAPACRSVVGAGARHPARAVGRARARTRHGVRQWRRPRLSRLEAAPRETSTSALWRPERRSATGRCTTFAAPYRPRCTNGGHRQTSSRPFSAIPGTRWERRALNKALYLDERRRALERWADHLHQLVTGERRAARIVRLPGKRK